MKKIPIHHLHALAIASMVFLLGSALLAEETATDEDEAFLNPSEGDQPAGETQAPAEEAGTPAEQAGATPTEEAEPAPEAEAPAKAEEAGAGKPAEEDEDFLVGGAADAPAEEEAEKKAEGEEKWGGRIRDHHMQGAVNILAGVGWFLVAPYEKNDPKKRCMDSEDNPVDEGEPVCTGRSGFHLDFTGGFGALPGFEVFVIFRLGLEQPTSGDLKNQPKVRQIGAGVKIYSPREDSLFKIGFGVAPLFDFSDHGPGADVGNDFVVHVPILAQFDIVPWFAPYIQVSPNISFVNEFRLEFTGGLGLQGRFP